MPLIRLRPLQRSRVGLKSHPATPFADVTENGLEFIERGVVQLWDNKDNHHLKYSVIAFFSGVELLLKARLLSEHWALVFVDVGKAKKSNFAAGDFSSVGLDGIIERLQNILGEEVPKSAVSAFQALRQHRNKMVHFAPPVDSIKDRSKIVDEQCRAWFHLRRLLNEKWASLFAPQFLTRINAIDKAMKRHREHLVTVYGEVSGELKEEEKAGAQLAFCSVCEHNAHSLGGLGPIENNCRVCGNRESFLRHKCGSCEEKFLVEKDITQCDCPKCDEVFNLTEIADVYTEEGSLSPEDSLIDDATYGYCSECGAHESVGTVGDRYFCFSCHEWHQSLNRCAWCNSRTTEHVEDSYLSGCNLCEGHAGWHADD